MDENLGGKKIIKDESIIVDRDINGARNIFIKCLTRQFEP
jgi:transposase